MTAVSAQETTPSAPSPATAASRAGSAASPSRRPSRSTRRPRRRRPPARSSASARASRTSRRPTASSRRPCRLPRSPRIHRYTPPAGCPSSGGDRREDRPRLRLRSPRPGAGHQRRQAGGLRGVRDAARPGRRVLLPAPYWTPTPRRSGSPAACRSSSPTSRPATVSVGQLEAARTPRTKVLLFCSPSNPTGAVDPPEQVEAIGRWALDHGIWVVADEIYEHLVYGGVATSRCRSPSRSSPTAASSSTASPRPTP